MKKVLFKIGVFSLLMIGLSGCFLKSVHPLFSANEAILIEGLDGTYENGDQRWVFASDRNPEMVADLIRQYPSEEVSFDPGETDSLGIKSYLILYRELDKPEAPPVLFLGNIGEIDNQLYLNLKLFEIDFGVTTEPMLTHRFNVNTFSRISFTGDELSIEHLESSWIKDQIMNNRVRIKHEVIRSEYDGSNEVLITASTNELQQFVKKYGNEKEAYQKALTFKKVAPNVQ